jgi:ankyrin repeat protein
VLLEYRLCVNSRDIQGKSPLHYLVETYYSNSRKARDIVLALIQYGANVDSRDHAGRTVLHRAATIDWTLRPLWQVAGELIKAGADLYATANDGRLPLDMVPDSICAETQRIFLRSQNAS